MARMIKVAGARGAVIRVAVAGSAQPACAADEEATETTSDALIDGVFLEIPGAMVTTHLPDGEGEPLACVPPRRVFRGTRRWI